MFKACKIYKSIVKEKKIKKEKIFIITFNMLNRVGILPKNEKKKIIIYFSFVEIL